MPITSAPTEARARTNSRWFRGKFGSTKTTRMPATLTGRFATLAWRDGCTRSGEVGPADRARGPGKARPDPVGLRGPRGETAAGGERGGGGAPARRGRLD